MQTERKTNFTSIKIISKQAGTLGFKIDLLCNSRMTLYISKDRRAINISLKWEEALFAYFMTPIFPGVVLNYL